MNVIPGNPGSSPG